MASAPADGFLIGSLLWYPAEALSRRVQAGLVAAGFTDVRPAYMPVFRFLPPDGERVTELAARVGTTKQAMGYLVEALVDRGYVERLPDPRDGRAQLVRRTAKGWAVNRIARQVVAEVQAEWTTALGEARMGALLAALGDVVRLLGVEYQGSISEVSVRPGAASRP